MVSSELRSVGGGVFRLLARSRKALAPVARAVHASFELKYDLDKVDAPDHAGTSPSDFRWKTALVRIKGAAEREISGMPTDAGSRGAHLWRLRLRILDEISAAAKEMGDLKTSLAVFRIRAREFKRLETAIAIDQVTEKPSPGFTE